jgi:ATP-dependent DNA ligase
MPSPDSSTGLQHNVQMDLPVMPPVSPMLAKSVKSIPPDASYEPKWDGFRSILFRDGEQVEVGSRNEKPMTRYFPELVAAATAELPQRCVIDGEIVIATDHGLDFEALQQRIHPADSRVRMLAEKTPASFIAFDLLALGDVDFTARPFSERRAALVDALAGSGPSMHVTPATTELATAQRWFDEFEGAGLDGVIAKPLTITYQPDKRIMFKIKHERTADCVVAGYRVHKSGDDDRLVVARVVPGRRHACVGRRDRCFPDGRTAATVRRAAAVGDEFRRSPVELGGSRSGRAHTAQERVLPLERGQGPVVRAAATRPRCRGALRPHGR